MIAPSPSRRAADVRIARARALASEHAATTHLLSFYADVVGVQQTFLEQLGLPHGGVNVRAIAGLVPEFLVWLRRHAPAPLAQAAAELAQDAGEPWPDLFERYWTAERHELADVADVKLFVVEAMLQPFAEAGLPGGSATQPAHTCPACGAKPVVAVLREHGHGTRRALVCGLCLAEFAALRLTCAACGESRVESLPVFRAEQCKGVRIDACDTCRTYLKTFDLSENGHAVPVVDDLATLPLDLWAGERGYKKTRPNLLRI